MQTSDNGWECEDTYAPVIEHLEQWGRAVAADTAMPTGERLGLSNRIDSAVKLLALCQQHRIHAGAEFLVMPELVRPDFMPELRIISDGESDQPAHWRELLFDGSQKRLRG